MLDVGNAIFGNLPIIFGVGVAIGLSNNDGVAGLSAIVGYLVMNIAISSTLGITPEMMESSNQYAMILGIPTLQTGVIGGIIIGVLASNVYNRFYEIKLPRGLDFFAGRRSVPIITAFSAYFIGLLLVFIWPPIQNGINALSDFIVGMNPGFAGFMFGFIERLTIPFGMNHVWWPTFWLQAGEYVNSAGNVVNGDQLIFFSQLSDGVDITAGTFMNGLFLLKIFSMPAVAFAIYKSADKENREKIAGILIGGAITSVVSGITEPLEFLFIFLSPVLFFSYAVLTGLGFTVMNLLGSHLGLSFSGGLLDYLFFNLLTSRTKWWILIPVGIAFFVIYYLFFMFMIKKLDLKTPGRTTHSNEVAKEIKDTVDMGSEDLAVNIIKGLGGANNIKNVNACFSRLRVSVADPSLVDSNVFSERLNASGVSILGNNVQVIYGNIAPNIAKSVIAELSGNKHHESAEKEVMAENISNDPMKLDQIVSPFTGQVIDITDVKDHVFADKVMGDGFAIELTDPLVKSPINGRVIGIFNTKHAISLLDNYGNEILLHIGLDTVELAGEGFRIHVEKGDTISAGETIAEIDIHLVKEHGYSLVSPIVFTNLDKNEYKVQITSDSMVEAGNKDIIKIVKK